MKNKSNPILCNLQNNVKQKCSMFSVKKMAMKTKILPYLHFRSGRSDKRYRVDQVDFNCECSIRAV